MIIYNVVIGSTYSRWINFARTQSFLAVLWMSLVVTYYTAENQFLELYNTGSGVWNVIIIGWVVLWTVYSLIHYFFVLKWEDDSHKSSDIVADVTNDEVGNQGVVEFYIADGQPHINVLVDNTGTYRGSLGRNNSRENKELRPNSSFASLQTEFGSPGRYRAARPVNYNFSNRNSSDLLQRNSIDGGSDTSTNINSPPEDQSTK